MAASLCGDLGPCSKQVAQDYDSSWPGRRRRRPCGKGLGRESVLAEVAGQPKPPDKGALEVGKRPTEFHFRSWEFFFSRGGKCLERESRIGEALAKKGVRGQQRNCFSGEARKFLFRARGAGFFSLALPAWARQSPRRSAFVPARKFAARRQSGRFRSPAVKTGALLSCLGGPKREGIGFGARSPWAYIFLSWLATQFFGQGPGGSFSRSRLKDFWMGPARLDEAVAAAAPSHPQQSSPRVGRRLRRPPLLS